MVISSCCSRGGVHFSASSIKHWKAVSLSPYFLMTRPAKRDIVALRLPSGMTCVPPWEPLGISASKSSADRYSLKVISPGYSSTSGFAVPKKKRAASRALVSKYGKMVLTSFFISLYAAASVMYSMGNRTWNLGRAGLPFFSRI